MKKVLNFIKSEEGYGVVELLVILASVAGLAVLVTSSIGSKLTSDDSDSAVNVINGTITELMEKAGEDGTI